MKKRIIKGITLITCLTVFMCFSSCQLINKKPTKEAFFEAHSKLISLTKEKEKNKEEGLVNEFTKALYNDSYTSKGNMKIGLELPEELTANSNIDLVKQIMNKSQINYNFSVDKKEKKEFSEFGLSYAEAELLKVSLISTEEDLALKIPLLHEKYFYINLNEMDKVLDKFGVNTGNMNFLNINNTTNLDEIKNNFENLKYGLEEIKNDYLDFAEDFFEKDAFQFGSEEVEVGSKKVDCNVITLTIDPDLFKEYVKELGDKIKEDNKLKDYIVENVGTFIESITEFANTIENSPYGNAYGVDKIPSKEDIEENYGDSIDMFVESLNDLEITNDIVIKGYLDKNKNIVKDIIEFNGNVDDEEVPFKLEFGNYEVDDNNTLKYFQFEAEDNDESGGNLLIDLSKHEEDKGYVQNVKFDLTSLVYAEEETMSLDLKIKSVPSGTKEESIEIDGKLIVPESNVKIAIKGDGKKQSRNDNEVFDLNYEISLLNASEEVNLDGNIVYELSGDVDNEISSKLALKLNIGADDQTIGINIENQSDYQFGKVDIPEISDNEKIDLANVEDEEFNEIGQQIVQNVQFFIMNNQDLLQLFSGF